MLVKPNPFKATSCGDTKCHVCVLDVIFSCKDRDTMYGIFCQGIDQSGQECINIDHKVTVKDSGNTWKC